jgi:tRNA A-37 threonylcarbamoyl transferase component Bud32
MERIDGPTMLASLFAGQMEPDAAGRTLADLGNALHSVPALDSMVPFERVIHLDLHPDNVILSGRGPVLIDWRNSTDGPPGLDNAVTAVIIAQAVLARIVADFDEPARAMLRAFLDTIDHPIGEHLDEAISMRRNNVTMSAFEVAVLDDTPAFIASVV